VPLTISVGLSQWQGDEDQLATMMARADAALYRAKRQGRGTFCLAGTDEARPQAG